MIRSAYDMIDLLDDTEEKIRICYINPRFDTETGTLFKESNLKGIISRDVYNKDGTPKVLDVPNLSDIEIVIGNRKYKRQTTVAPETLRLQLEDLSNNRFVFSYGIVNITGVVGVRCDRGFMC